MRRASHSFARAGGASACLRILRAAAVAATLGLAVTALMFPGRTVAQTPGAQSPEVGLEEKLGEYVPLDLPLYDETGAKATLGDFVKGPTILALVYYRCPGICNPLLGNIADVLRRLDLKPAEDFTVVTVSFDPSDTPALAAEKKNNFLNTLPPDFPSAGWRFLTADSTSIKRITDAVGFRYKRDGNLFVHSAALTVLSPEGKIVRYLYGIEFLPFDFEMAVAEASKGKVGPTISRVLAYCYSYDPQGRKYVFNITKVAGTLGLISVAALFVGLTVRSRVKKRDGA
jgi:protein SCO1/2